MNMVDLDYMKTFMLTYQSFTTPGILLAKLIERYHVLWQRESSSFPEFEKARVRIQSRVCNVLLQWVKKFYFDFIDSDSSVSGSFDSPTARAIESKMDLRFRLLHFTEEVLVMDHPVLARTLRKNILKMVRLLDKVSRKHVL
jgi:hypothetical protein